MENILVTGGAGYIGSHIVEQLLKKKKKVLIVDNLSTGYKKLINILINLKEFSELNFVNTLTFQKISLKKESDLLNETIENRNFNYLILEKI